VRSPSAAFAASSVATVSFTIAISPPPRRLRSSAPTYWPTIAGAWMFFVQRTSFASSAGVATAGYEKHQPIFFAVACGFRRRTSSANAA